MRLEKIPRIRFGRESKKIAKNLRKDIIYKVYLGDRQIWKKRKTDEEEKTKKKKPRIDSKLRMKWFIYDYLVLANVTSATSIVGTIDWGDGTVEDWESGYNCYHKYAVSGIYDVTIDCSKHLKRATIGQISSIDKANVSLNYQSYLKEIGFCEVPYLNYKLAEAIFGEVPTYHMFEAIPGTNTDKLESVQMLLGVQDVPVKMFYGTSLKNIVISGSVETLGQDCFVRKYIDAPLFIRLEKDDQEDNTLTFGQLANSGIGYQVQNNTKSIIPNITVQCPEEWTSIINYLTTVLGANVITYLEEEDDEEIGNGD